MRRLGDADYDTLLLSACDKLHNARAIEEDMASIGPPVFDRFTAGHAGTKWYYRALKDVFAARLGGPSPVVCELRAARSTAPTSKSSSGLASRS